MKRNGFKKILLFILILFILIIIIFKGLDCFKQQLFKKEVKNILKKISLRMEEEDLFLPLIDETNIKKYLKVGNKNYQKLVFSKDEESNIFIMLKGQNKWEGLTACGTLKEIKIGRNIICKIPFICGESLYDKRDNNQYQTVEIGEQCWMAEDLRYKCSNYLEGENISTEWNSSFEACAPQGDDYDGLVYQWKAAMAGELDEGVQGLCPNGWYLPTDTDWKELELYLGLDIKEVNRVDWRGLGIGDQLKSFEFNWCFNNDNCGTSGFKAIPGGHRETSGKLGYYDKGSYWWSSTSEGPNVWGRSLRLESSDISRFAINRLNGWSVRCLLKK
jgi:uncharacterized protein (TIGR02145 family)